MSYSTVELGGFAGGLNLRDQPGVLSPSQAVDLLNVTFTERGTTRQRAGYAKFTPVVGTNRYDSLSPYYTSTGTKQLLAGAGTRLETLSALGAVTASATGLAGGPWSFAHFGAPNSEVAYAGNGTDTLRKWNGSSWSAPTATVDGTAALAMPKGGSLAVSPTDNRLVISGFSTTTGGPNGGASSPSHVYFSKAGDPESYAANDYVQLRPGDGEAIKGVIAWRDLVFVFKETIFFVFYSTSSDATGQPVFNYRAIDAGVGMAAPGAVCAGPEGVYFVSRTGVYRTTGQEPQEVSGLIDPIFSGNPALYFRAGVLNHTAISKVRLTYHRNKVYLAYPAAASNVNSHTLVYDPNYQWWSIYDFAAAAMTTFRPNSTEDLLFAYSGSNYIARASSDYTNDDGVAIASRWLSGWIDFSIENVKTLRQIKLAGGGSVRLGIGKDYALGSQVFDQLTFGQSSLLWSSSSLWSVGAWGPSSAIASLLSRKAVRGTVFNLEFANSTLDTSWAINRATADLRASRPPTVVGVDS